MSHPLQELRTIMLGKRRAAKGTVIAVMGDIAKVRTFRGVHTYTVGNLKVKAGDSVSLSESSVTSVLVPPAQTSIFDV